MGRPRHKGRKPAVAANSKPGQGGKPPGKGRPEKGAPPPSVAGAAPAEPPERAAGAAPPQAEAARTEPPISRRRPPRTLAEAARMAIAAAEEPPPKAPVPEAGAPPPVPARSSRLPGVLALTGVLAMGVVGGLALRQAATPPEVAPARSPDTPVDRPAATPPEAAPRPAVGGGAQPEPLAQAGQEGSPRPGSPAPTGSSGTDPAGTAVSAAGAPTGAAPPIAGALAAPPAAPAGAPAAAKAAAPTAPAIAGAPAAAKAAPAGPAKPAAPPQVAVARPAASPPPAAVRAPGSPQAAKPAAAAASLRPPLNGSVLDGRGRRVSGARVLAGKLVAVTDDEGRFTLTGVPRSVASLRVEHPSYVPVDTAITDGLPDVRLVPGAGVSGQLGDRRLGSLPSGARLTIEAGKERRRVQLGSDGRFTVTGLPAGPAKLRAEAPGYVTQTFSVDLRAGDEPGEVTLRDEKLEIERGGTLTGEVKKGDVVAAGVQIVVVNEVGDEVTRLKADKKGAFRAGPLPPGRLTVQASAPGVEAQERVSVYAGDEARVTLDLR